MPQMMMKKEKIIHVDPLRILIEAMFYIKSNWLFCLSVFVANWAYILLFKMLPGGISNPLSIVCLIVYYVCWCAFYRYYYQLRPYFFVKAITGSLKPSTKAAVLLFLSMILIVFLPMIPLLLGYNDVYLDIYERYVHIFESLAEAEKGGNFSSEIYICYAIVALISPPLICRPYMAWISSLQRQNASFKLAGDKMRGNYWALVLLSVILLFAEAVATQIDKMYQLHGWLDYSLNSVLFVYMNIVFAKLYDFFYVQH